MVVFILQTSGQISISDIKRELAINGAFNLNMAAARNLAGKPTGAISLNDFYGKRTPAQMYLSGVQSTGVRGTSYDTGDKIVTWHNIPATKSMSSRVWATTYGSHRNDGPSGYVYIRWIIKNSAGVSLSDTVRIERNTSGDGAGGIGQWSESKKISDIVGDVGNVSVTVSCRFIAGDYQAHIDGGQYRTRRINGIENNVGF
ncbi:MAG: hypothetical protein ACRC6B_09110 [Fusobacteriaceae bacterium]